LLYEKGRLVEKNTRLKVLELIKETDPEMGKRPQERIPMPRDNDTVIDTWALMASMRFLNNASKRN
jgi:hypothetical protein